MHQRPVGPPLSARMAGLLSRSGARARRAARHRAGRLALGALVSSAAAGLVLTVPVVAGSERGAPSVVFDSSAAATRESADSPVVMGVDGQPLPATEKTTAPRPSGIAPSPPASSAPASSAPASSAPASSAPASPPAGPSDAEATVDAAAPAPTTPSAQTPAPVPTPLRAPAVTAAPSESIPSAAAAPLTSDAGAEQQVLALVERVREEAGCGALTVESALTAAARAHSAAMRDLGTADLGDRTALDTDARIVGVAQGQSSAAAVESWVADPTDGAGIRDCDLTTVGVGLAEGAGGPWWTLFLA